MLGLSITATQADGRKAAKLYKDKLNATSDADVILINEQLEKGDITKEQSQNQLNAIKKKKTHELAYLNKLKKEFDSRFSRKRKLATDGKTDEDATWMPMYKTISEISSLKLLILRTRPLSTDVTTHQKNSEELFSETLQLIDRYRLKLSTLNDQLFEDSRQADSMDFWELELQKILPKYRTLNNINRFEFLLYQHTPGRDKTPDLFEEMNKPYTIQIKELDEKEMDDFAKTPDRKGDIQDTEALRRELLKLILESQQFANTAKDAKKTK